MTFYDDPADDYPLDDDYYMLYARRTGDAMQMFIAKTKKGDDEFDEVAERLGLTYITHVVNHNGAAHEWADYEGKRLADNLPVEIRLMEDGEVVPPDSWLKLPVENGTRNTEFCTNCGCSDENLTHWKSICRSGYPVFCSAECLNIWYVELPLTKNVSTESIKI